MTLMTLYDLPLAWALPAFYLLFEWMGAGKLGSLFDCFVGLSVCCFGFTHVCTPATSSFAAAAVAVADAVAAGNRWLFVFVRLCQGFVCLADTFEPLDWCFPAQRDKVSGFHLFSFFFFSESSVTAATAAALGKQISVKFPKGIVAFECRT